MTLLYVFAALLTSQKPSKFVQFVVLALVSAYGDPFSSVMLYDANAKLQAWRGKVEMGEMLPVAFYTVHDTFLVWLRLFYWRSCVPLVVAWCATKLMPAKKSGVGSARVQPGSV